MSVLCNLRHFSSFPETGKWHKIFHLQVCSFSSFSVESGWSVQYVPIILNCFYPIPVANPESSGILSKAYGIPLPGDLGTLLLSLPSVWEIIYLSCKTCSEVLKEKRTNCFHSNIISLLAFHKLKPRGQRYHMIFFTEDATLYCSCTQKSWKAWLKLGHFHLISQVKIYGTTYKATQSDHARHSEQCRLRM